MAGKRKFSDILREFIENGELVRRRQDKREYELPRSIRDSCENPEVFDRYNHMVVLILSARGRKQDSFESLIDSAIELWREIENELPVFSGEDVVNLVRKHVGYVDFNRCAELAMKLAEDKPLRYKDIRDMAKKCKSFKRIEKDSMGRVLSRVLSYLEKSGLLIKTWSSRKTVSYYFRIYRTIRPERQDCRGCKLIKEIKKLLESYSSGGQGFEFSA